MVLAVASVTVIVNSGVRADASSERLHTLSSESIELAKNISPDRPVLIQALHQPRRSARVCRGPGRSAGTAEGVRRREAGARSG